MPTLRVNGYEMSYVEQGAGEPVLLVHGALNDYRYWAPQMEAFAAGFRAVAVSLRHYWPERWDGRGGGFTVAQHVDDVASFIAALGAGPVHLVGHSRGGHIAFHVAERHPRLLRKLVLAEPSGALDGSLLAPGAAPAAQPAPFASAAEHVARGDIEGGLRRFAEQIGGPGAWERRPEARKLIARDNAHTLLGQSGEGRRPFSRAEAEAIRAPTLLVAGANTPPALLGVLEAFGASIEGARRVTIADAGHGMNVDNPGAFNAAVLGFLAAA